MHTAPHRELRVQILYNRSHSPLVSAETMALFLTSPSDTIRGASLVTRPRFGTFVKRKTLKRETVPKSVKFHGLDRPPT
jgi:hypothetical protein